VTEVTPQLLKTQGFHNCLILLFYDHPANGGWFSYAELYAFMSGSFLRQGTVRRRSVSVSF
jgi:hypothetical protein